MSTPVVKFNPYARLLHWSRALMILAMLFIGVGMVSTTTEAYTQLVAIHKLLGAAILVLVLIRLGVCFSHKPPPLPLTCRPGNDTPPRCRTGCCTHWCC